MSKLRLTDRAALDRMLDLYDGIEVKADSPQFEAFCKLIPRPSEFHTRRTRHRQHIPRRIRKLVTDRFLAMRGVRRFRQQGKPLTARYISQEGVQDIPIVIMK